MSQQTMNKLVTSLAALSIVTPAFAGDPYVVPPAPYVPAPDLQSDLDWFMGASAGYLEFAEEPMYTFHIGREIGSVAGWTSSIYVEGAFTEIKGNTLTENGLRADLDGKIIPITLNYKLDKTLTGGFGIYAGLGAGLALVNLEATTSLGSGYDRDTPFYGQAFLGLEAELTETLEIFGGARYIYLDDTEFSDNGETLSLESQDGFFYEGGLRLKF